MKSCDEAAIKNGFVVSRFGRVRHIPKAKAMYKQYGPIILDSLACRKKGINDLHWELKSLLNLAKNHPIQSTAAYVINKASIEISLALMSHKLFGILDIWLKHLANSSMLSMFSFVLSCL